MTWAILREVATERGLTLPPPGREYDQASFDALVEGAPASPRERIWHVIDSWPSRVAEWASAAHPDASWDEIAEGVWRSFMSEIARGYAQGVASEARADLNARYRGRIAPTFDHAVITFGRHAGVPWEDAPVEYLRWLSIHADRADAQGRAWVALTALVDSPACPGCGR